MNRLREVISWLLTSNIRLNTFSARGCRQWYFAWSLGEFRVFQHHTPLPQQTQSEMISLWYNLQFTQHRKRKKEKLNWLFIYLDDYRPLIRASDWLLKTTNQIYIYIYIYICMCIYIYIYIYMSRSRTVRMEFLDFLTTRPNHLMLLVGLQDSIQCPHRADVCNSLLVSQSWRVHVEEYIKERCSWVGPYFCNFAQLALIVMLGIDWEMGGKWPFRMLFPGFVKTTQNLLVLFQFSLFSKRFFSVQEVHQYVSTDTDTYV